MSVSNLSNLITSIESKSRAYEHLETLCLCYPGRLSGSDILESALDFLQELGTSTMGLDVNTLSVPGCPQWVRGSADDEKFVFEIDVPEGVWPTPDPLKRTIRVLAHGMSVGTSPEGVTGKVVSVANVKELEEIESLDGCIVLYDWRVYTQYGELSGPFRGEGAHEAAKHGAIAALVRSIAPDGSTSGLHTGSMSPYKDDLPSIPAACVTAEDAELMTRLLKRGYQLHGKLTLPCVLEAPRTSRNIIFEIPGETEEVVVIGGHTDAWECHHLGCQGAHDDGQGVIVCMEALRIIKEMGVKPKRTIRAVLFVDEECRQTGAKAYFESMTKEELDKIYVCMETDLGAGPVIGFGWSGGEGGADVMREILKPMDALQDAKRAKAKVDTNNKGMSTKCNMVNDEWPGYGVDTYPLVVNGGVPGILLRHEDTWWYNDYFHHHHTASDTIDHVDEDLLMLNLHCVAAATWLCANSDRDLPRNEPQPAAVREKKQK